MSLYYIYYGSIGTTIKAESNLSENVVKRIALNQLDIIPSLICQDPGQGRQVIWFGKVVEKKLV